jgi:hypothetical protein
MKHVKYFLYGIILSIAIASCTEAVAHEMLPTYPKMEASHIKDVYVTSMRMFNKRQDVEFYEIGVFDEDWNPIPFVTSYSVIKIEYLGRVEFDLYIRKSDVDRAEYICSKSKLRKQNEVVTAIASRICSRIK